MNILLDKNKYVKTFLLSSAAHIESPGNALFKGPDDTGLIDLVLTKIPFVVRFKERDY
jgi:hypothetical protein